MSGVGVPVAGVWPSLNFNTKVTSWDTNEIDRVFEVANICGSVYVFELLRFKTQSWNW